MRKAGVGERCHGGFDAMGLTERPRKRPFSCPALPNRAPVVNWTIRMVLKSWHCANTFVSISRMATGGW
jgi:hypothetical protein